MESRYNDTTPVKCKYCEWEGLKKDCVHTWGANHWSGNQLVRNYSRTGYAPLPVDVDAEAADKCPVCGADEPEVKEDK